MAAIGLRRRRQESRREDAYVATQWTLMWRKFKRHKLAMVGTTIVVLFYLVALFAPFLAPHDPFARDTQHIYVPPQRLQLFGSEGFGLHVSGLKMVEDPKTWARTYASDPEVSHPVSFFVRGHPYKLFGLFPTNIHLFGTQEGPFFVLGTDESGRDMFSRIVYAIRTSMTIGLIGVTFTFILGSVLGAISGFYGGPVDFVIQRIIEFILCIPAIPLWMALSAAVPQNWTPNQVYFSISIILSLIGWCSLARVVRGKMLELRQEEYITASRMAGASDMWLVFTHLLPGFISYLIVALTLSIPSMILAETSLSFLGLGLRPPAISLGVLLQQAQNINTISLHPYLIIPGLFIFVVVLGFNFMGDGLRDAADPYK